jgi:hypothetical protein
VISLLTSSSTALLGSVVELVGYVVELVVNVGFVV